jgi:hypothetical protein
MFPNKRSILNDYKSDQFIDNLIALLNGQTLRIPI